MKILALLRCDRHIRSRVVAMVLVCNASLLLVPVCFGKPGIFVNTNDLMTARYSHTATLLPNEKVLVAGGIGLGGGEVASAELYDPESGTWASTGPLVNARDGHTATLLPNGKVLVAGGYGTSGGVRSAELYDPASGLWSPTGSMADARYYHTATLLPNGKVLVAGGINLVSGGLAGAELYDSASGTWSATAHLVYRRNNHTATLLASGKVLVAGGYGPPHSAELYDPVSGTWALTGAMVTSHEEHTATLLRNGKVLVAGADACCLGDAELYDPANGTWTSTGNLITPRTQHTATPLENGKVLVVAGDYDGSILGGGELYDPVSETWMTTANAIGPARTQHTATMLANGQVLVAGGTAGHGLVWTNALLYISGSNRPPTLLNLSTRVDVFTGDRIAIGGFIIAGSDSKTVLIRGMGPSLNGVGVTLSDPTLELHQGSTTVTTNDNWKMRPDGTSQQADIAGTGLAPSNDQESAILITLAPGSYTVMLSGKNGGTGMGLVELYDMSQGAATKLANLSTRGYVRTGDNVLIGGVIVGGGASEGSVNVLVRALGPSLVVEGALNDPSLELYDGSGSLISANDNWKTRPGGTSQQSEIEATGLAPANDLESALLQTLPIGSYTAIVRGTHDAPGVGLVEVYNLQ